MIVNHYLPAGLPAPVAESDGIAKAFWSGLREEKLRVQRCAQQFPENAEVPVRREPRTDAGLELGVPTCAQELEQLGHIER